MVWRKKSTKRPYILDCIFSKEIISDAYNEGYINWPLYRLAMEKISSNMNSLQTLDSEWSKTVQEWEDKYLEKRRKN